jgi:hypothetical protein
MKWLRLRRWVYPVVHLIGIAGLASTVCFVVYSDDFDLSDQTRDVWVSVSIELLMLWLAVVAIDGIIGARRAAATTRGDLRGFLNFVGAIVRDLPPDYYVWRVNDLTEELRWARELVLPKSSRYLTDREQDLAVESIRVAEELLVCARHVVNHRDRIRDADLRLDRVLERMPEGGRRISRSEIQPVEDLDRLFRAVRDDYWLTPEEVDQFNRQAEHSGSELTTYAISPEARREAIARNDEMLALVEARVSAQSRIEAYKDQTRLLETQLLGKP